VATVSRSDDSAAAVTDGRGGAGMLRSISAQRSLSQSSSLMSRFALNDCSGRMLQYPYAEDSPWQPRTISGCPDARAGKDSGVLSIQMNDAAARLLGAHDGLLPVPPPDGLAVGLE
jgi:hypothetical protein